ncbi:hypothetical protein LJC08_03120 [Methanimicrococcus sp. OttesenSCG-928-J09]|nr:hypothetical protein [Methanimicrococcus sp. OttesenSCG-928-J09]
MTPEKILRQAASFSKSMPVLFVLALLIFSSLPVVSAEEQQSYFSADYIQEIIDNTPATNPALLDQARSNSKTITVSGTIPALQKGNESYNWFILLQGVMKKINTDGQLGPYLWDNGGFIVGYGSSQEYIEVFVNADSTVSDEEIAQVVQIITNAGKEYGINDIPIIIERNTHAQGFIPSESTSPKSPDEIKTIPGVGLYICALLVVATVLITRKYRK